jgi:GNAT superfamily N-acetyltransferase
MIESIRARTINPGQAWLNLMDGTRPVGMISGGITTAPWNNSIVLATIEMFYVLQSHRSMDSFRAIVRAFEEFAKQCGATSIYVSDMGMNESRTRTLYEQLGYTSATSLVKRI